MHTYFLHVHIVVIAIYSTLRRFEKNIFFIFTEDNNTRVLFERVLSSGGLTPQLSVDVWNRFLEFESNIGDLSSIVKVERRRSAVLENVRMALNLKDIF